MDDDRAQEVSRTSTLPTQNSQSNPRQASDRHEHHADYCVDMLSYLTGMCVDPSE